MQVRGWINLQAELRGPHWGLLPAIFILPFLLAGPMATGGIRAAYLLLAFLMASYDLACRRIPNPLTLLTALTGLAWAASQGGWSLGVAALAGLAGFGLMAVFFFMGAVGAGDVKALGALSTFLTPYGALMLFVCTALMGGVLAVLRLALAKGFGNAWGAGLEMPYGLAILGGVILHLYMVGGAP